METKNVIPWKKGIRGIFGFTLVELIVVITILVILGTIAFINLWGFNASARDSSRVSDMTNISKGLELALVRNGTVPVPEAGSITVSASGVVIGYQGYAGSNVLSFIKMSEAKDPLDKKYYTYSTNVAYTKYEMLGLMEDPGTLTSADVPSGDIPFVDRAYAGYETRTPATKGSSLGVLLGNTGASLNVPVQESYSVGSFTGVDVVKTTTLSGYTLVFAKNDTTASVATSGTGAYTGSLFTFAYNKRDDLIANKALASSDPSLVGYWDMETMCSGGNCGVGNDGKLKDFSMYGNNGTLSGSIQVGNATWKIWKGTLLSWSGGFVVVPNNASINPASITICTYIQRQGDNADMWSNPIYKEDWSGKKGYNLFVSKANDQFGFRTLWSSTNYDLLKWYQNIADFNQYCGEYQNTAVSIYKNWVKILTGTGVMETSSTDLRLGGSYINSTLNWIIDEVRIYNRALSDSEIQALYNATK